MQEVIFNNALEHGAVLNDYMGILTLNNCTFENNSLKGESYIWGGAIYNKGILNVSDSVFKNNSVISNKSYARSGAILIISEVLQEFQTLFLKK